MDLIFRRGDRESPRGHALVYFQDAESGGLVATYAVVLPINLDIVKYVPPLFASQMGQMAAQEFSAFALPPLPEPVESLQHLEQLAEARDDDILDGGQLATADVAQAVQTVAEIVESYARLYRTYIQRLPEPAPAESARALPGVLFDLMGESERLQKLSKLTGQMRYALENGLSSLATETEEGMRALARYLPEHYRVPQLILAARVPGPRGAELAQLYLERCYKLSREEYRHLAEIEERIRTLEAS